VNQIIEKYREETNSKKCKISQGVSGFYFFELALTQNHILIYYKVDAFARVDQLSAGGAQHGRR
jgi:hypothetical protein